MHLPQKGIEAIYKQRKLPIAALQKKAPSMTNKSIEIHEIWLAVLTAYHTRKPKDWSCAVGQRWVILYWNVKCQLTVQSWCCFKMHENCMEQKKQRVVGNAFRICMQASKYAASVVTHKGPGPCKTGPDQGCLMPFWHSVRRTRTWKTLVVVSSLWWRCVACWVWQQCSVQQQSPINSSFYGH